MEAYALVIILLFMLNVVAFQDAKLQKTLYKVALFILFCMTAFRWNVGCDFSTYEAYGRDVAADLTIASAMERSEPGYWVTTVLLHDLGIGWEYIDVLGALSFYWGMHAMAKREPNPLLFLTLAFPALILGLAMSTLRQSLAMGFICFAFNAFADRNRVRFVVYLLIGSLFHKSSLAFLAFAPFLFPGNIKIKLVVGVVAALPMVYFMGKSDAAETYANMYLTSGLDAAGGRFRVLPISLTGLYFLVSARKRWAELYKHDYERMIFFSPVIVALLPLVLISSVMGDRFCYYMMPLAFSIQTRARSLVRPAYASMAFFIPLGFAVVLLVAWMAMSTLFWQCYVPYRTWWT